MRYYKINDRGYIISTGTGNSGTEITEQEYALPPVEPEPLTDEDALVRYANTLTGQNDPDLISAAETLIEQRIKEE